MKSTPQTVSAKRTNLNHELQLAMSAEEGNTDIPKAIEVLEQLEETYSTAARKPGAVRFDLWPAYFFLGRALHDRNKKLEAVDFVLKGLEALGYIITAYPRRENPRPQRAKFKVIQWGLSMDVAVKAFIHLSELYSRIAPKLFPIAQDYAKTVYTIVVGEQETFLDMFPEYK